APHSGGSSVLPGEPSFFVTYYPPRGTRISPTADLFLEVPSRRQRGRSEAQLSGNDVGADHRQSPVAVVDKDEVGAQARRDGAAVGQADGPRRIARDQIPCLGQRKRGALFQ